MMLLKLLSLLSKCSVTPYVLQRDKYSGEMLLKRLSLISQISVVLNNHPLSSIRGSADPKCTTDCLDKFIMGDKTSGLMTSS